MRGSPASRRRRVGRWRGAFDDHNHSRSVGRSERRTGGAFEQVPRRLHSVEAADPKGRVDRLACLGPVTVSPIDIPLARGRSSSSSTARSSSTPLSSVAEWIC